MAARVILGLGTSAAYPAAMAMVRVQARRLRTDPPGSVLGALAVAGQATMAVGPPLGSLIALGGWRLTRAINIPLAAIGAGFALAWLPVYAQAPSGQTGAAAGLLRTFMYLGAIASAGITGFAFGARATDAGLHHLATILTVAWAVALAAILADRSLRRSAGCPGQPAASRHLPPWPGLRRQRTRHPHMPPTMTGTTR